MAPQGIANTFDELARGLSSSELSRAKALRLMGAALVGGMLASMPRVAATQEVVCTFTACCQCDYADNTGEEVRTKCFPMRTSSCGSRRQSKLQARCEALCEEFRATRHSDLTLTGAFPGCKPPNLGNNLVCERNTSDLRGTQCRSQACTPPA